MGKQPVHFSDCLMARSTDLAIDLISTCIQSRPRLPFDLSSECRTPRCRHPRWRPGIPNRFLLDLETEALEQ